MNDLLLLPPPAAEPAPEPWAEIDEVTERLRQDAQQHVARGEMRQAALMLHRSAALALQAGRSPLADLAMAARLLEEMPAERALVLADLGQALREAGDPRRALLALRESERLAREAGHAELLTVAREALGQLAEEQGNHASARAWVRGAGMALAVEVEQALLATLRDVGNLPPDPRAERERARRERAVEEELAALKQELKQGQDEPDSVA